MVVAEPDGRRLPYGILWVTFLACMFVGAGLVVAGEAVWGALLFAVPLGAASALTGAYYLLERGRGGGPKRAPAPAAAAPEPAALGAGLDASPTEEPRAGTPMLAESGAAVETKQATDPPT